MDVARRVQAYIEHSIGALGGQAAVALDGFTLYLHASEADPAENPILPAADLPSGSDLTRAIEQALAACAAHGRQPCFSFVDQAAPTLAAALEAFGLECRERLPALVATSADAIILSERPDLAIETITAGSPLDAIRENLDVNALGFDPTAALASAADAEGFRQHLAGSQAFTLRLDGAAVAAGMRTAIHAGVAELTGIATLEPFRRRGLARHLTAALARAAFAAGADLVFLVAATPESAYVYRRAGFADCGERLAYGVSGAE
ncbi:MAG TPA: GNAT family N-acetyltransferase [Herpetosiphonaceae bacterium]|nr:GNAT family N-acetyltransferase [Herpetosiphonaceae bacterium]